MSDNIKLNKFGKILKGRYVGWFIFIKFDGSGYSIVLTSEYPRSKNTEGYDYWVEDYSSLIALFSEIGWKIDWDIFQYADDHFC